MPNSIHLSNVYRKTHLKAVDYEIMELVLFNAIPKKDVKPLAKLLLTQYHSIGNIINLPLADLAVLPQSVGTTFKLFKDVTLLVNKEQVMNRPLLNNWDVLLNYVRTNIGYKTTECLHTLFLNHKNIIIFDETTEHGTINSISIYPREILKKAILHDASAVIVVHNHPSGTIIPSRSDISLTRQLKKVLSSLDIALIDHIIISSSSYYSFKQHKVL